MRGQRFTLQRILVERKSSDTNSRGREVVFVNSNNSLVIVMAVKA